MLSILAELTREDVAVHAVDAVAVVPVGSVEQHGPHLPLSTDTLLVETIVLRALSRVGQPSEAFVLAPTITVGSSHHHLFASAVSLRAETLRAVLADVCDSLVASGFRRIVMVNGHGGNDECVSLAVKEIVLRHPVAAAACSYWAISTPDDPAPDPPGHAGCAETSMMLAAHPGLVHMDLAPTRAATPPALFDQREVTGLAAQRAGEWARVDGVTDPAATSDAEHGEALLDGYSRRLAHALSWFVTQNPRATEAPV